MGDIYLNVAEVGEGEPLLFIHGWGGSWLGWTLLAEELSNEYKIYMVDLPGFGDSDSLERYSIDAVSKYIDLFIKKHCPDVKAIIGASGGVFIAVNLNENNNQKFSLILISAIFKNIKYKKLKNLYSKMLEYSSDIDTVHKIFETIIKRKVTIYVIEKYINSYEFDKKVIDAYIYPSGKKATGKSYVQLGVSILKYLLDEEIKKTKSNTLLIFGKHDRFVNPETARAFIRSADNLNLSLSIIDKAGHCVAHEQPEETGNVIRKYLNKID